MSDDLTKTGKHDRIRVNVRQVFEVRYWTKAFGVTKATLIEASKAVGPMVEDIRAHLIEKIRNAK